MQVDQVEATLILDSGQDRRQVRIEFIGQPFDQWFGVPAEKTRQQIRVHRLARLAKNAARNRTAHEVLHPEGVESGHHTPDRLQQFGLPLSFHPGASGP